MSACTNNFDTPTFLITALTLLVEMLLIALQNHTVFLLEQHFTFAVVSLLMWHLLFKLLRQSKYFSFTRNPNNANLPSKLAATSFVGLISYKQYKKVLCITHYCIFTNGKNNLLPHKNLLCFIVLIFMDYKYNLCKLHTTNEIRLHAWIL